jgi:hypothetical protein
MNNSINKSYSSKNFKFKSGNEIKCQGYEPFALQELIDNNINETDIITGCKNVPIIWYNDEFSKNIDIMLIFIF